MIDTIKTRGEPRDGEAVSAVPDHTRGDVPSGPDHADLGDGFDADAHGAPLSDERHEAFCRAYAAGHNGAEAARQAGYKPSNAKVQASRLLLRAEVLDRVGELRAGMAAARVVLAGRLLAKLEPVYDAALAAGEHDTVLQAVELQARIGGLVTGGATIRPRHRAPAAPAAGTGHVFTSREDAMEAMSLSDEPPDYSDAAPSWPPANDSAPPETDMETGLETGMD